MHPPLRPPANIKSNGTRGSMFRGKAGPHAKAAMVNWTQQSRTQAHRKRRGALFLKVRVVLQAALNGHAYSKIRLRSRHTQNGILLWSSLSGGVGMNNVAQEITRSYGTGRRTGM